MTNPTTARRAPLPASFRDPSGFVFKQDGILYRQINTGYEAAYKQMMTSGLYAHLVERGMLISHQEVVDIPLGKNGFKIIKPELVSFISYPYEWAFSQLKDAAILTLKVGLEALDYGLVLKDASAYNVQFHQGRPVLIDTLSFDVYVENRPWDAYRQFCQHFLAPLALAAHVDIRLVQLLRVYIDGIPLDLASRLLPWKTRLDIFGLGTAIHQHARMQKKYSNRNVDVQSGLKIRIPKEQLKAILKGLQNTVQALKWQPKGTEWGDYYLCTNYSPEALGEKGAIVSAYLDQVQPKSVWDLGANTGLFSRLAAQKGISTIAFDIDPAAVEIDYLTQKRNREEQILPLWLDLTNPSPGLGWAGQERGGFLERSNADLVMALALIHHLAISNNLPLEMIASLLATLGSWAIVEFVPKEDSQVQKLLRSRKDIFEDYNEQGFEDSFMQYYEIVNKHPIQGTHRILYLLKKRAY